MREQKKLIVSHAPFWHNGSRITNRSYHTMLAALPAVLAGIYYYGIPALGVVCLSVATAMLWEMALSKLMKRPVNLEDGNAMVVGLLFNRLREGGHVETLHRGMATLLEVASILVVFGAMGLSPDTPLADLYTAGRTLRFADGPDEVHLQTIARLELRAQEDRLMKVMKYLEPLDSGRTGGH